MGGGTSMDSTVLDLHDIQGNIVKAYGRYGFPKGRYVFFEVCDAAGVCVPKSFTV